MIVELLSDDPVGSKLVSNLMQIYERCVGLYQDKSDKRIFDLSKGRGTSLSAATAMISFEGGDTVRIPKLPGRYSKGLDSFGGFCSVENRIGPVGCIKLDYSPRRTKFPMLILAFPDDPEQQHPTDEALNLFQELFAELGMHRMYIRVSENSIQKPPTHLNCDYIYRSETKTITAKHDTPPAIWKDLFQTV
jgi:hypothetical protein